MTARPDTAQWVMGIACSTAEGEAVANLQFSVDPALPGGQCWLSTGGDKYYPVSDQLLRDLRGMFPAGANLNDPGEPAQ